MKCPACHQASSFIRSAFTVQGVPFFKAIQGYSRCRHCGKLLRESNTNLSYIVQTIAGVLPVVIYAIFFRSIASMVGFVTAFMLFFPFLFITAISASYIALTKYGKLIIVDEANDNIGGATVTEQSTHTGKFQWKWVWISLLMYLVFYFLPISLVPGGFISGGLATKATRVVVGVWGIAGIFIIAAVAGFLSKGVTIKEPAVAAAGVVVLWILAVAVKENVALQEFAGRQLILVLIIVGLLAIGGAWFGERAQKLWKGRAQEQA